MLRLTVGRSVLRRPPTKVRVCLASEIAASVGCTLFAYTYTWSDNKVRELIAVKMLHASLLNTTVVAFKILPLGSYVLMPVPSPPFKTILELVL